MKKQAIVVRKGKRSSGVPPLSSPEQSRDGSATLQSQSRSGVPPLSSDTNKRRDAASTLAQVSQNTSNLDEAKSARMIPLANVTETRVEQTGPQSHEFTYVDIGCIDRETKRIVDPKMLPSSKAPSRAKQLLQTGDVLVSMTRPNLNAVAIVPPYLDGAIGSTGFHVLRARDAEPAFLFYAVQSNEFIDAMCLKVQGALYPAVRPRDISSFCIPPSSFAQQHRIVAEIEKQFTRLEAGVSALKRVQANLKRYRAAVLKAACEGKLVPTEAELQKSGSGVSPLKQSRDGSATFETGEQLLKRILAERRTNWIVAAASRRRSSDKQSRDGSATGQYKEPAAPDTKNLPPLPDGWTWATFEQISTLITKGSSPNWQGFNYCVDGIVFVRSENVRWGTLDLDDVAHLPSAFNQKERKSILREGDVLLNLVGASIGRAAIATADVDGGNVNQAVAVIRLVAKNTMNQFAMLWLNSTDGQKRIHAEKVDVARANFSLEDTRGLPLPLPPLAEQTRIVAEVERRLSVVEELEATVSANLQRATRLRQSILQKAFSGELA